MALTQVEPYMIDSTANVVLGNVTVSGKTNLGTIANITITGGSVGQLIRTDGAGNLTWADYAQTTISPLLLMGA